MQLSHINIINSIKGKINPKDKHIMDIKINRLLHRPNNKSREVFSYEYDLIN